jgi:prephenate dehydrogenase
MGGSLARALAGANACREIIGVETDSAARAFALQQNLVHRTADFDSALAASDLLILATPVRTILDQLSAIRHPPSAFVHRPSSVVLDLGSTKSQIVAAMQNLPPGFDPLGGHPMCGKEAGGIAQAEAGLFRGKTFVRTDVAKSARSGPRTHQRHRRCSAPA